MSKHEMLYIALAVIAVAAIAGLVIWAIGRRTSRLQSIFGPEYDHTIDMAGRKAGERELGGGIGDPAKAETGTPAGATGADMNNGQAGEVQRYEGSRW